MTGTLRVWLVTALAVAVYPTVTASPAAAKTTTSVSGDVITVHLEIDCIGCKGKTVTVPDPENPTQTRTIGLAEKWELDALAAWGNAFQNFKYCGKYRLELDLTINELGANAKGSKGNHRVRAGSADGVGGATAGWKGEREENPSGPDGQRSPDGTRFYERDITGTIPVDATSTIVAHEIGHPLGLGDDRDNNGNVIPGREGTMMVGGANDYAGKNSAESHLRIDQSLINRIGAIADRVEPDVKCNQTSWNGTLNGTGVNDSPVCRDVTTINGPFSMTVKPDGNATMNIHWAITGVCQGATASGEFDFTLEGKKTRSQISFAPAADFPWPLNLRVRGDHASGSITVDYPQYHVTVNFDADCQNCDEGVG
jgi:hypothetical protein